MQQPPIALTDPRLYVCVRAIVLQCA